MNDIKKKIRLSIKKQKSHFTNSELGEMSNSIISKLKIHPWLIEAKTICIYNSLPDEVNTHNLIEDLQKKGTKILLPSINKMNNIELHEYVHEKDELITGVYGIKESNGNLYTNYNAIDLVIVPGVAFDLNNNRLGRGKGYYDCFLKNVNAKKIGICFSFQMLENIPAEEHDVKMDAIITDSH